MCSSGNVGVACGPASGFVVLDVDPRNGGDVSIRALAASGYAFPACPRQKTGNGGFHLLFRWEGWLEKARGKFAKGVDVKKAGGFIVVAPSWTRASDQGPGGLYRWEVSPFDVPLPKMPAWMKEKLVPPPAPKFETTVAGPSALHALIRDTATAKTGNRNSYLYWACRRAKEAGSLTRSAQMAFIEAAVAAGEDRNKAAATVWSAAKHGD